MTTCCFNIFTVLTIQSFIFHQSHGFNVIQPKYQTVNLDRSASISCEHTTDQNSVQDVRLNGVSPGATSKPVVLCQRGQKQCNNIVMYQENPKKYIFIILNIGPEAMKITYQCEFTVIINGLDDTKKGSPTTLQEARFNQTKPEDCVPAHPSSPPLYDVRITWTLIGLLVLTILYSCIITGGYFKLRMPLRKNNTTTTTTTRELDNSTYVEMRKAPLTMNPSHNIYHG